MALPQKAPGRPASPHPTQLTRRLKKGELLFSEGENSRAMYFLKSGMIRLYKKKGDSVIELDTVHSGQVLGELAFLDGNPRSASGEALTDCELTEVSGAMFQETLSKMPEWLKILLRTVVGRLRTTSTRVRQLETASVAYDYSDKDGKRSAHYVYLSMTDVMKIGTGILLVASRNGTPSAAVQGAVEAKTPLVNRYVNNVMGVPVAKITSLLDVFNDVGITAPSEDPGKVIVRDVAFLEQLISYLNEQNLTEPSKRHDLSARGFIVMSLMAKYLPKFPKDAEGLTLVNLAEIRKLEQEATGKEAFRMDEAQPIIKFGYAKSLNMKSANEAIAPVEEAKFMHAYRLQKAVLAIQALNEQKRTK